MTTHSVIKLVPDSAMTFETAQYRGRSRSMIAMSESAAVVVIPIVSRI
jgi:hypothetical protein